MLLDDQGSVEGVGVDGELVDDLTGVIEVAVAGGGLVRAVVPVQGHDLVGELVLHGVERDRHLAGEPVSRVGKVMKWRWGVLQPGGFSALDG